MKGYFVTILLCLTASLNAIPFKSLNKPKGWLGNNNKNPDAISEDTLRAPELKSDERSPEEYADEFEGDIVVSEDDRAKITRTGIVGEKYRWPNAMIPYIIDSRYNSRERDIILSAMREIQSKTCIKFSKRTSRQKDYIYILSEKDKGCSSRIGRSGGRQDVRVESLTDSPEYNCMNVGSGTTVHELIHAIGFVHMQSATTRDDFVIINYDNIDPTKTGNFDKYNSATINMYGTAYDYASIMHYGKKAFTTDGSDTITTIDSAYQDVIGQRTQMSNGDITRIKKMYNCTT